MHIPPWRKADYMKSKWLSSHNRTTTTHPPIDAVKTADPLASKNEISANNVTTEREFGEFELIFGETTASPEEMNPCETDASPEFYSFPLHLFFGSDGRRSSTAFLSIPVPPVFLGFV
ncbi:hypothetical protein U1Q18_025512 [Sarracenia purpurea var. burkii]